jgi:hypothetical protein
VAYVSKLCPTFRPAQFQHNISLYNSIASNIALVGSLDILLASLPRLDIFSCMENLCDHEALVLVGLHIGANKMTAAFMRFGQKQNPTVVAWDQAGKTTTAYLKILYDDANNTCLPWDLKSFSRLDFESLIGLAM